MAELHETRSRIIELIVTKLSIEPSRVTDEVTLDDLGADSLDMIELIMKIEDAFDIHIDDDYLQQLHSIKDLVLYVHNLRKDG